MRRNWIWILPLAVAITIVWLSSRSSYPFGISLPSPFDKVAHMTAFGVLAAFTHIAWRRTHPAFPVVRRLLVILIGVAIFGASDELHQYFVPGRSCDVYDWMADVAGGALGLALTSLPLLWHLLWHLWHRKRTG